MRYFECPLSIKSYQIGKAISKVNCIGVEDISI